MTLHSIDENGRDVSTPLSNCEAVRHSFEIDVTDEAYEDMRKYTEARYFETMVRDANAVAADPAVKGRVVKVVSGRKAKGTVGKVVVIMDAFYGMGYRGYTTKKLGIATSPVMVEKVMPNGKVFMNHRDMEWVWAKNCEVETPEAIDENVIRTEAKRLADATVSSVKAQAAEYNAKNADYIRTEAKRAA